MEIFVYEANGSRIFLYSFVKLDKMWKKILLRQPSDERLW